MSNFDLYLTPKIKKGKFKNELHLNSDTKYIMFMY